MEKKKVSRFAPIIVGVVLVLFGIVFLAITDSAEDAGETAATNSESSKDLSEIEVEGFNNGISNADVPPEGTRSIFDHVIKENGVLPFPFEKLMDVLTAYSPKGEPPVALLMPDARSLEKGKANFHDPRMVVAAQFRQPELEGDFGLHLKHRMFLGYIEPVDQIEVISYNEGAGRFEFQLVENYCKGCVPRIVYARRSLCLPCHQNKAPIFPVRDWLETNSNPKVVEKILESRNIDPNYAKVSTFHGVPLVQTLEAAQTYDDLTNGGNVIPTTQDIWIRGCGNDQDGSKECRRLMLQLGLRFAWDPGTFNPGTSHAGIIRSEPEQKLLAVQEKLWPEEGIPLHDPDILNRDPFNTFEEEGFFESLKKKIKRSFKSEEEISKLEELKPLPAPLDPLTKRPPKKILTSASSDGIFGISQFFTRNDVRWLKQYSDYEFEKIEAIIQSEAADHLLNAEPFKRIPVMKTLLSELGVEELPNYCCENDEDMSPPLVQGVEPLKIAEGSKMHLFKTYCFACHRGNPSERLNFMSGETEEVVWEKMAEVPEIRDVLEWEKYLGTSKSSRIMPPADAYQREQLEQAGKKTREEMIDALPSFLF